MRYFFWLIFLLLTACHLTNQKNASLLDSLSLIPIEDQKKLEVLFQRMMTGDYFAATLFGSKPLTFQEFHEDPWKFSSHVMVNPYNHYFLDEGWKTWLKYKEAFPSRDFIFTKIPSKGGYEFLILINRPEFKNIFTNNRDLFEEALGKEVTIENIFQDFESQNKTFEQILNDHEGLIGLVLGYGREGSMGAFHYSALEFQILKTILHPLSLPLDDKKLPRKLLIGLKWKEKKLTQQRIKWHQVLNFNVEPSQDPYSELCKNYEQSEFFLPSWQEQVFQILPPNFSVIKGSESTKLLKREYEGAMLAARKSFNERSFLVGFLEQYCK